MAGKPNEVHSRKTLFDGDSSCDYGFIVPLVFQEWNWRCIFEDKKAEKTINTYICPKQCQKGHFTITECLVNSL